LANPNEAPRSETAQYEQLREEEKSNPLSPLINLQ